MIPSFSQAIELSVEYTKEYQPCPSLTQYLWTAVLYQTKTLFTTDSKAPALYASEQQTDHSK